MTILGERAANTGFLARPYHEVKARWCAELALELDAPWGRLTIEVSESLRTPINEWIERGTPDVLLERHLFPALIEQSMVWVLPRAQLVADNATPSAMACGGLWPRDAMVKQAQGDVASLLTLARAERLRRVIALPSFAQVEALATPRLLDLARHFLTQSHYVTREGHRALLQCHELGLAEYIAGEAGHDELVKRSLDALGGAAHAVTLGTRLLVELLSYAAAAHLPSLALLLDVFEGGAPPLLWQLVTERLGDDSPMRGVLAHSEINARENHGSVGLQLALRLGRIDTDAAHLALALCEWADVLRIELLAEAYSSIGLK